MPRYMGPVQHVTIRFSLKILFPCFDFQLLPKRIDWQGNEHDQSYAEVVSSLVYFVFVTWLHHDCPI